MILTLGQNVLRELRKGLDKMLDAEGAAVALQEFELFRRKLGEFSTDTARCMAIDRKTSAAAWWATFGEDAPMLSQVARRLLSQCVSSSGCERNWSTFAYIHTKLRNRLSHKKLDKWCLSTTTSASVSSVLVKWPTHMIMIQLAISWISLCTVSNHQLNNG